MTRALVRHGGDDVRRVASDVTLRQARVADAAAIHALVGAHVDEGRLLPRALDELSRHADRFIVATIDDAIEACAELAPLSRGVAEVRSLVVANRFRRAGIAAALVARLREQATASGFETLTAFTHDPRFFVRQGFSIAPRLWVPEKIATDCQTCALFLSCQQHAMLLPLACQDADAVHERRVAVA